MLQFWNKLKKNPDKSLYWLLFVIFIASMIPIWYLAKYTVPSLDDYYFGIFPHHAWKESHSLAGVIKGAWDQVYFYYFAKQATYSSIFLMALFPGVLDESYYVLTPFIMTGMLIGSITVLTHTLLKDCMGIKNKYAVGSVNLIMLFLVVQTLIAPLEAIYWYNGALHYVFMQSVMYFEVSLILHYMHTYKRSTKIACLAIASILGIIVGGANLITGLQACIISAIYVLVLIGQRIAEKKADGFFAKVKIGRFEKKNLFILIPIAFTIVGFMCNALAPGNALREEVEVQMNPIKAVIMSFEWGAIYAVSWMIPMAIVALATIAVIIWKYAACGERNYLNPLLMGIISYGVFSAMLTPTFYATSADAPTRVKNIIGTALYVLILINMINGFGYYRRHKDKKAEHNKALAARIMDLTIDKSYTVVLAGIVTILMIFVFTSDKNAYTSMSAVRSAMNGEAKRYYEQCQSRIELYLDDSQKDITISKLTEDAKPYLLFKQDVGNDGDEGYWQIVQLRDYYDKDSITVIE